MPSQIPETEIGRLAMRSKGGAEWIPLADFTVQKGCSSRTVQKRPDIVTKKIDGHTFVHRSALAVAIRGRGAK